MFAFCMFHDELLKATSDGSRKRGFVGNKTFTTAHGFISCMMKIDENLCMKDG